jgi:hypothetical protein
MKDSTIIIILLGGAALLFWAVSTGLIQTTGGAVRVGPQGAVSGVVAPQPAQNYSGFLAASTAPGVSSALNSALSGIGNAFSAWLTPHNPTVAAGQGPVSATPPTLSAQPSGPVGATIAGASVGPIIPPELSYDATTGAAYDWMGLANANSFDPSYSLQEQTA